MSNNQTPDYLPFVSKWLNDTKSNEFAIFAKQALDLIQTTQKTPMQPLPCASTGDAICQERMQVINNILLCRTLADACLTIGISALNGEAGFNTDYRTAYEYLMQAWHCGNKNAALPLLELEWKAETSLLSSNIFVDCIQWLAKNGDAGFSHYLSARKELMEMNLENFFRIVYCYRDGLTTLLLLQFAVERMLQDDIPTVFYNPMLITLEDLVSSDPRLYYYLGRLYGHAYNPEYSISKAHIAYRKGAYAGSERCQYALYYAYYYGDEVHMDYLRSTEYLNQYCESGNYRCMVSLAHLYLTNPEAANEAAALQLLQKAALKLSPVKALLFLACYYHDKGNYTKALEYSSRIAECGTHNNCYADLWIFNQMLNTETDPDFPIPSETDPNVDTSIQKAYIIWRKLQSGQFKNEMLRLVAQLTALCKSDASCSYYLALCYEQGIGLASNEKMAAGYMKEAELASYIPAMLRMAEYYEKGFYVNKDINKAIMLYEDILNMSCYRGDHIKNKLKQLYNV